MAFLCVGFRIPQRRACRLVGMQRSSYYYRSRSDPQTELRVRLKHMAGARVRYGYRRLHILLQREGWQINHKLGLPALQAGGAVPAVEDKEEACQRAASSAACCNLAERMLEHGFRHGSAF